LYMDSLSKIYIDSNPQNITCGKPLFTNSISVVVPDEYYEEYIELLNGVTESGSITVIKKSMDNVEPEIESCFVAFDTQGGNIINPITVASGSAIVLPQPVKPNNKFDGWYEDLQFTRLFENGTVINKDITLYAKWIYNGSYSSNEDSWTNDTTSWNDVTNEIKSADNGEIVTVKMNGTSILPKSVLEEIKGKDISIRLEFINYTWSINGKNIADNLTDIDFYVHRLKDFEIDEEIVSNSHGYENFNEKFMLDLSHNGDFGCSPVLNVRVGETNATYANLYYINEDTKQLEFEQSSKINTDNTVDFNFSHASKYVVILSDTPIENLDIKEPTIIKKVKTYTNKKVDLKNRIENLEEEATVTYKSSNDAIAIVSKDGIIKAKKSGTVVITINIKQNTKEYEISTKLQVSKPYIKIVKKPSSSLKVGKTYTLSCKAYGTGKAITYSSSNKKVLTINKNGKIKAKRAGKAVITIKSGKYVKKVTLKVK
ncbi:InlB B-repeat-containing protein, partial [Anaerosporobacter sp.]